jgi:ArsR family transcriptional regulator, lead/cadmium/zinc/bismuth-responsive transcriptional repressor
MNPRDLLPSREEVRAAMERLRAEQPPPPPPIFTMKPAVLERAARILWAMGDVERLRILYLLKQRERCVTEIVAAVGGKFPTVSQRLKLLHKEGLIRRRRKGCRVYYGLRRQQLINKLLNAVAHASELDTAAAHTSR